MKTAPHPFTLRQLQYAAAVAEARHFRKAAEACAVSQPSLSAQLSEQLRIQASRAFAEHVHKLTEALFSGRVKETAKEAAITPIVGLRRLLERVQGPIFEKWIPNLKAAAYVKEAQTWIARNPEVLDDPIQYRAGLRGIAKSVDNRFGEMFYSNLFWNRTIKDAGIGSFLSLGWNLGFVREFGGGAIEPLTRRFKGTETREAIRSATNKTAFALFYTSTALMIAGAMTWAFTGKRPDDWIDLIFPRLGGLNPDGTPRRLSTMFYTREVPMAMKHIEERQSIVGGLGEMLWNKMMFQPFRELAENKDYWGYEIWDENAPLYKQAAQFAQHILSDQLSPITISGAQRAYQMGGGTDIGIPLAMLGFGPAPAYAEKTAFQNRVTYLYGKRFEGTRPFAERDINEKKREARIELQLALQSKDPERIARAQKAASEVHAKTFAAPYWVHQFAKLPVEDQMALVPQARGKDLEELKKYLHSNSEWKRKPFRDKSAVHRALNAQR